MPLGQITHQVTYDDFSLLEIQVDKVQNYFLDARKIAQSRIIAMRSWRVRMTSRGYRRNSRNFKMPFFGKQIIVGLPLIY